MHQRELVRVRVARAKRRHQRQRVHGLRERERRAPRQDNLTKRGRRGRGRGGIRIGAFVASRVGIRIGAFVASLAHHGVRGGVRGGVAAQAGGGGERLEFRQNSRGGRLHARAPSEVQEAVADAAPGRAGRAAAVPVAGGEIVDVGVRAVGVFLVPHVIFVSVVPPRGARLDVVGIRIAAAAAVAAFSSRRRRFGFRLGRRRRARRRRRRRLALAKRAE